MAPFWGVSLGSAQKGPFFGPFWPFFGGQSGVQAKKGHFGPFFGPFLGVSLGPVQKRGFFGGKSRRGFCAKTPPRFLAVALYTFLGHFFRGGEKCLRRSLVDLGPYLGPWLKGEFLAKMALFGPKLGLFWADPRLTPQKGAKKGYFLADPRLTPQKRALFWADPRLTPKIDCS